MNEAPASPPTCAPVDPPADAPADPVDIRAGVPGGPGRGRARAGTRRPTAPPGLGRFGVASPGQLRLDHDPLPGPHHRARRRRWPWAVGGLAAAAALCAGSFVVGRDTKPSPPPPPPPPPPPATAGVVALSQAVTEGQVLTRGDLTVVTLVKRPGVRKYFPVSMESDLLGRRVRAALPAGALILGTEIANGPWPAKGQALVGLDLQPSEAPTGGALVAGDQVGVLFVPAAAQPPYPAPVPLSTAEVVSSVAGQTGDSYVTVLVSAGLAARLAAYAQHDEVALVWLGPGVAWPPPTAPAAKVPTKKATPSPTTIPKRHDASGATASAAKTAKEPQTSKAKSSGAKSSGAKSSRAKQAASKADR